MLTRLIVSFYSGLIEIALWLFIAGGGYWGYMNGESVGGLLGGTLGAFVVAMIVFGPALMLDDIRKSLRNIERNETNVVSTTPTAVEPSVIGSSGKYQEQSGTDSVSKTQNGIEPAILGSGKTDQIKKIFDPFSERFNVEDETGRLILAIRTNPEYSLNEKIRLIELLGGQFCWETKGFFSTPCRVVMVNFNRVFSSKKDFENWVSNELVKKLALSE